jgi:hypothetical protein
MRGRHARFESTSILSPDFWLLTSVFWLEVKVDYDSHGIHLAVGTSAGVVNDTRPSPSEIKIRADFDFCRSAVFFNIRRQEKDAHSVVQFNVCVDLGPALLDLRMGRGAGRHNR